MVEFKESKFYKLLQDFFINNNKETFLQMLAEFYNRTEGIIDKNKNQDELIKELRELYLEFNEKGIDENIVIEKVNYFVENNVKIKDILAKLVINTNKIEDNTEKLNANTNSIENINSQLDTVTSNKLRIINAMEYIDFKENVDCSNDINTLIQSMKKNETLILPYFNYYINNTIVIDRDINFICNGVINYSGNESAIKIIQSQNKKIEFTRINATNGTCIELFSNTGNFIQYLELKFKELFAKKYCLFLNLESESHGWINENRFYGGRFSSGEIGCYADAKNLDSINSNKFFDIGVEGVELGYSLNNLCNYSIITNPRILESRNLISTNGIIKDLYISGTNILYDNTLSFSNETNGRLDIPVVDDGGGLISNITSIINGRIVIPIEKRRYKNVGSPINGIYDMRNERKTIESNIYYFLVNQNTNTIILNELYGKEIYQFYIKFNFDNSTPFTLKDSKENTIFNNTASVGWSLIKFSYCREMGWIAEKVNTLTLTT